VACRIVARVPREIPIDRNVVASHASLRVAPLCRPSPPARLTLENVASAHANEAAVAAAVVAARRVVRASCRDNSRDDGVRLPMAPRVRSHSRPAALADLEDLARVPAGRRRHARYQKRRPARSLSPFRVFALSPVASRTGGRSWRARFHPPVSRVSTNRFFCLPATTTWRGAERQFGVDRCRRFPKSLRNLFGKSRNRPWQSARMHWFFFFFFNTAVRRISIEGHRLIFLAGYFL